MIVNPIIILRLLAHKLFGNMIRRKSLYAETKLRPPKPMNFGQIDMCPPRTSNQSEQVRPTKPSKPEPEVKKEVLKKKKSNPKEIEVDSPSSHSVDKEFTKHNGIYSKNGNTSLALRAMGHSLANPFESNIPIHQQCNEALATFLEENRHKLGHAGHIFAMQHRHLLSRSQGNVAVDSTENQQPKENDGDSNESSSLTTSDIDIMAFQRELINLPTFVMDTPSDVSPVFSRSSSVPDNLASRSSITDPVPGIVPDIHRERGGSDHEVYKVPNSPSFVTIHAPDKLHFDLAGESSTDPKENALSNIVVRFEPPPSPISSASQSPQNFEFPAPFDVSKLSELSKLTVATDKAGNNALNSISHLMPSPTTSGTSSTTTSHSNASPWSPSATATTHSFVHSEIPRNHRGVLKVIETWIQVCSNDLDSNNLIVHEMRDFLRKLSVLGHEYKTWCHKIGALLHLEVRLYGPFF